MQPSQFTIRVPIEAGDDVFLMNTLTDAQLIVSSDVATLLDRLEQGEVDGPGGMTADEREAFDLLTDNGFLAEDRAADARSIAWGPKSWCSRSLAASRC